MGQKTLKSKVLKGFARFFLVIFPVLFVFQQAFACRIEIRRPVDKPYMYQGIQTREHSVNVSIKDQTAQITVSAVFYNPNNTALEGDYWFPLYEDAAVSSFVMIVDGKEMTAEILDADTARRTYEEIVRQLKDPGLLEYAGTRMLRQRIYPIKPRSEVRVNLKYTQVLKNENGVVSFKYPLSSAKPDNKSVGKVSVNLFIESTAGIKSVYSSSHSLSVDKRSDKSVKASFNAANYFPDKAFTLYYTLSDKDIGASVITHKPKGEDGYFVLLVSPKMSYTKEKIMPKDFVFVIDSSGSMSGSKMEGAKQALLSCLNSLNPQDRFNIINFSDSIDPFRDGLTGADAGAVTEAKDFTERIAPSGGTAIDEALSAALKAYDAKSTDGRLPVIVFLTDGMPTVGEQNINNILANVKKGNAAGARVFVFGVGSDVNTGLLDKLAEDNGGVREYVTEDKLSIERGIGALASKISSPILTDVKLEFKGVRVYDMFPRRICDLFRGDQLVIFGRYDDAGNKTLLISGKAGAETKNFEYVLDMKDTAKDGHIAQLWAVKKTAFMLDEINLHGANSELIGEIKKLGMKFGIVTPYTSFLITDTKLRNTALGGKSEAQAVEDFQSVQTGVEAVKKSSKLAAAKAAPAPESKSAFAPAAPSMDKDAAMEYEERINASILNAGDKTFIQQADGYFSDTDYNAGRDAKPEEVRFLSDEYFRLINDEPEIAVYLKVAVKVIVKFKGKVYKITE